MIYSPAKIKQLLQSVEDKLSEEDQSIVKEIVSNYNKLFVLVKDKAEYIKRKETNYVKESNENDKLRVKNKELIERYEIIKNQNKEYYELIKKYEKLIL